MKKLELDYSRLTQDDEDLVKHLVKDIATLLKDHDAHPTQQPLVCAYLFATALVAFGQIAGFDPLEAITKTMRGNKELSN